MACDLQSAKADHSPPSLAFVITTDAAQVSTGLSQEHCPIQLTSHEGLAHLWAYDDQCILDNSRRQLRSGSTCRSIAFSAAYDCHSPS